MNTHRTIRVGVIGIGFGALVQFPGFQRRPVVQLEAVASFRDVVQVRTVIDAMHQSDQERRFAKVGP